MRHELPAWTFPAVLSVRMLVLAGAVAMSVSLVAWQQPTFRSSVDLVAVDVQVVDADGNPVTDLKPAQFDVSIGGRRRRIVSVDLVDAASPQPVSRESGSVRPSAPPGPGGAESGRQFILAVDRSSFDVGDIRAPMDAARAFVRSLRPNDRVGLYSYPSGQQLPLTTDRAVLGIALGSLIGERHDFNGIFHLTPSEVVDITAQGPISNPSSIAARARVATAPSTNDADPVRVVQARECPDDSECATRIVSEATAEALHLEAQVEASLGGLERLLQGLARFPGRKAVVLISAGVLVADRPGGRPDAGNLAAVLGRIAAQANTIVYTIHIDPAFTDAYRAGRRRAGGGERDRDRRMSGDWLEQFSASSGGARFHVPVGPGDFAFERVSRETSAYYLLGVEPQSADRDGQPRELKVRVDRRGVTVRSRQWVAMGR